jgi:hypothetical protein
MLSLRLYTLEFRQDTKTVPNIYRSRVIRWSGILTRQQWQSLSLRQFPCLMKHGTEYIPIRMAVYGMDGITHGTLHVGGHLDMVVSVKAK